MDTLQEFKCPCCGGKVEFDSSLQQMKCPYCDTVFDVEAFTEEEIKGRKEAGADTSMNWEKPAGAKWAEGEAENLNVWICQSCGGEIVGDENTGATSCPFCGSPVVIQGRFAGELKPDFVIPFKIDKKAAKAALKKHLTGKKLLPKIFKDENHLEEVKGIYVPFWLFDAKADAKMQYKGTRLRTWSDQKYNYTETSVFAVKREGQINFERVPVDGSSKIANELMESIEPFDFSEAVEFNSAYLSGYLADKYDVSSQECTGRANERIRKSTETAFADTVKGYHTVVPKVSSIQLKQSKVKYALYPVWLLTTRWKGKQYLFAMNGQNGKFVGNLPLDLGAFWRWFFVWTGALSAAIYAIAWLISLFG